MKLSKKVTLIFIISTIISLGIYKVMASIIINKMYIGESEKISNIFEGVAIQFNNEIKSVTEICIDYATLIAASNNIDKEFLVDDGDHRVGLIKKMEKDNIEYKILLNKDLSFNNSYLSSKNDKGTVDKLLYDLKNNYRGGINTYSEIFEVGGEFYIVSVSPILEADNSSINGYILIADCIDNEIAMKITDTIRRNVSLVYEIEKENESKIFWQERENRCIYENNKVEFITHYKIISVTGESCYLQLKEKLNMRIDTEKTLNWFLITVSTSFIIINILVLLLIKKIVVKRIVFLNDEINKVSKSKQKNIEVSKLEGCDEVNDLAKDISDMIKSLEISIDKMSYLANYDTVTNIKNRYSVNNYINKLITKKIDFTIFYIDLDNFKSINDNLGHTTGDLVLCKVSDILKSFEGVGINVGRVGGDEFIIIKEGFISDEEIVALGEEFSKALTNTFKYKNYTYNLSGSIGISSYPKDGEDLETLFKYADIAMYRSKKSSINKVQIISDDMLDEIEIEAMLSEALIKNEFMVYYQPIFNLVTKTIVGAEALVRWNRNGEIILPCKFIAIAKKMGKISEIDSLVLNSALKFAKECRDMGYSSFQVSVNISFTLLKSNNFISNLKALLISQNLDPSSIKIEITEDEILDDSKFIIEVLNEVKNIGVQVSLDDFGVGYASFNNIKILPIDTIKIDRSLLANGDRSEKSKSIIESIIKMAHSLGFDVVCEGVEDKNQLRLLEMLGCDKIQGYYISKPVDDSTFKKLFNIYSLK